MNKSHESLVKYDSPTLINTSVGGNKSTLANANNNSNTSTEDILNSILPPREWTEDGQLWVQYVSSVPATRHDIVNLQQELDKKLLLRKARETGICPIREELYSQCFDELIRQITINCAERGLLLLRIRDEIRMTISSYQSLYESSIAFGMRKSLQSKQIKTKLYKETSQLKRECDELEKEINGLNEQIITIKQNYNKKQENLKLKHDNDIKQIKQQNDGLKQELEKLLTLQIKK
mmetsp:Transcript_69418/g.62280  ORF Transcript_69418/g.62280 Transcript_69418/m.62280 type:complete len:235 (-) Transcript_69418:40-744(-)